ncbi:hypothetical protein B0I37DRAFT_151283 [Chaetomium sp. MPI-CAGE-AT-0009]|nr:hypothetical protein B0I37DRAFT_151283 [Chaetomium sp. MPI-CAGE-AT-0009]
MSFGWSASDVVAALELLNKVRIALNDCGGASSEYQAECSFLQTLSITLGHLKTLKAAPLEPGISENISELLGQIEQPVRRFLDDIERTFGSSLGVSSTRRKLLTAPRKIQWALVVADRAKVLREKIGVPLSAILAAMSQQIIQTSLQMPVDIQSRLVDSIDSAVDSKLRPSFEAVGSEVAALSRQYHVSSSQILDSISTLKETTLEAFSKQHAKTCEGAIELLGELDKAISTRQASIIDTQQKIYNRVQMTAASTERELRASTEATQNSIRVLHQHTTDSFRIQDARNRACAATLHSKLDHMNSLLGLMGDFMRNMSGTQGSSDLVLADQGLTQAFQTAVRSLWVLVLSLQSLVKELMYVSPSAWLTTAD